MSTPSSPVSSSHKSNGSRRPVARRACLLCREKKIKCDGEPISTIKTEDGNKVVTDQPRVCSNCKFLGINCVFVASMRGGRRKKRQNVALELSTSPKGFKHLKPNSSKEYESASSNGLIQGRLNNFILDQKDGSARVKPVSPTISYSLASYSNNRRYEDGDMYQHMYDYRHYPPPPPPPHHGGPPPPPPHYGGPPSYYKRHYGYDQPPLPPPPPPHMFGYGGHPPPPPPHLWKQQRGAWPPYPPPPPPHLQGPHGPHELPPPHLMRYAASHSSQRSHDRMSDDPKAHPLLPPPSVTMRLDSLGTGLFDHRSDAYPTPLFHNANGKPVLPPLEMLKAPATTAMSPYDNSYYNPPPVKRPPVASPTLTKTSGAHLAISSSSASASSQGLVLVSAYTPAVPERVDLRQRPPQVVVDDVVALQTALAPFTDDDLAQYDLPKWEILEEVLNYYFIFHHLQDQLLTNRQTFLERFSLNRESLVLHALLLRVCRYSNLVDSNETVWIDRVYKHWEDLGDIGMLLCYLFLGKTATISNNYLKFMEISSKIYELIEYNRYLEVFQKNHKLNFRQAYEREIVIRVMWNYWEKHLILFRYKQGLPYYKLSMINKDQFDFKFTYEMSKYYNRLLLPLQALDHLFLTNLDKRATWESLGREFNDSTAIIYSLKVFELVLNNISKEEVPLDIDALTPTFMDFLHNNLYWLRGDKIMINPCVLRSTFITRHAIILNHGTKLKRILTFNFHRFGDNLGMLLDDVTMGELLSFEDLPAAIGGLNAAEFKALICLFVSTVELTRAIELGEGHVPEDPTDRPVVIGATLLKEERWYDKDALVTRGTAGWLKYDPLTLDVAITLVLIIPSLVILTKFLVLSSDGTTAKLQCTKMGSAQTLGVNLDAKLAALFEADSLLKAFDIAVKFVHFKLKADYNNERIYNDTVTKINKISHYLEEILQNT